MSKGIRIRLDLSELVLDHTKLRWIYLASDRFKSVADLIEHLRSEYELDEEEILVNLFLEDFALMPWEEIGILHQGDLVKVSVKRKAGKRKIESESVSKKRKKNKSESSDESEQEEKTKNNLKKSDSSSSSDSEEEKKKRKPEKSYSSSSDESEEDKKKRKLNKSDSSSSDESEEEEKTKKKSNKSSSESEVEEKSQKHKMLLKPKVNSKSSSSSSDEEEENSTEKKKVPSEKSDEAKKVESKSAKRRRKRKRKPKNKNKLPQLKTIAEAVEKMTKEIDKKQQIDSKLIQLTTQNNYEPTPQTSPINGNKSSSRLKDSSRPIPFPISTKSRPNPIVGNRIKPPKLAPSSQIITADEILSSKSVNQSKSAKTEILTLKEVPQIGSKISFKVLEMGPNYTPGYSALKTGEIIEGHQVQSKGQQQQRPNGGKFDLEDQEEPEQEIFHWNNLIEPKLIQ